MDPGFRRRMFVAQGGLVAVCVLSAVTAIIALSFTNRTNHTLRETSDDIAAVDALRSRLARLAAAGERVLLADDGLVRFRETEGDVDRARQHLRARAHGSYFAIDAETLDRNTDDLEVAIDRAANALSGDPRASFIAYRAALKAVRDAFDADATSLTQKMAAHRDESSYRTTRVATRARWALVLTAAVAILMSLAFAGGVMRALSRQRERNNDAADLATRSATSRRELLAASKDLRSPIELILRASAEMKSAPSELLADEVHAAAERLRGLVDDLLDVSGVEAGTVDLRCERCDARALIEIAVKSLHLLATERAIQVLVVIQAPIVVYVDRRRLIQVLATLIGMAIRNTRPGGEVTVTARGSQHGARFAISDAGVPTLPDQLTSMFDRPSGHVLDQPTMSLYVAKRLVEAHGGRVGSEGNALWFSLPTEPRLLSDPSTRGAPHPSVAS